MEELLQEKKSLNFLLSKREEENTSLKEVLNELMTESNSKDLAIAKASKVIDMLRVDLEKAFNDLKQSENTRSKLLKENRDLEKELLEVKKGSHQMNAIKKSETRAKNEKQKLKDELNQTNIDFGNKENELLKRFSEITEENKRLQGKFESFHEKMKELQDKLLSKEKQLIEAQENLQTIDFKLQEERSQNERLEEEKVLLQQNHHSELSLIKREAENKIRLLQSVTSKEPTQRPIRNPIKNESSFFEMNSQESGSKSSKTIEKGEKKLTEKPKKKRILSSLTNERKKLEFSDGKEELYQKEAQLQLNDDNNANPNNNQELQSKNIIDFLKDSLNEGVERERKLMEKLDGVLKKEAKKMAEKSEEILKKEMALRPEVERWIMKCEELNQRIVDYQLKISNMTTLIKDYEKAISLIKRLNLEEKKNSDNLAKELESNINFFQIEIQEKNKQILETLPYKVETFHQLLENSQSKIQDLTQNISYLKHSSQILKQDRDYIFQSLNDHKKSHSMLLNNLLELQKLLSITPNNSPLRLSSRSREQEPSKEEEEEFLMSSIHFDEIYKKLEFLIERISELEKEIYLLKTEKNDEKYIYENEKCSINEQLNFLQDNLNKMNKRLEECNEVIISLEQQNQDLKEAHRFSNKTNEQSSELAVLLKNKECILEKVEAKLKMKKQKIMLFKKNLIEKDITIKSLQQQIHDYDTNNLIDYSSKESKIVLKKSLGNSMSFEENLNKNLLNIGEEDSMEEFSVELLNIKDQSEFIRRMNQLKQKMMQNKWKFQKKLKEFELILRFLEKALDFLIDNNSLNDEKDPLLQELLEKNENLRDWMQKLKGSLHMIATKNQRNLASERDFSMKVGMFLMEIMEIGNSDLKALIENIRETPINSLKYLNIHNFKGKILELIEESQRKRFKTPKKENKSNEVLVFLKEIYSDLKDIIGKCSFYSTKLDEKLKKIPNFSKIVTEDSYAILNVLNENLGDVENNYMGSLKFLWENYFISLKEIGNGSQNDLEENHLKHLFFTSLNTLNQHKIQEELGNLKSAMNLLDISHYQNILKNDEKTSDLLRKKSIQNNEILQNLIDKSSNILEVLELPYNGLDWNEYLKEGPLSHETRFMEFFEKKGTKNLDFLLKNSISRNIFEIIRENAGFKISFNNLIYILQKYKNIIEEVMRNRISGESVQE